MVCLVCGKEFEDGAEKCPRCAAPSDISPDAAEEAKLGAACGGQSGSFDVPRGTEVV